MWASRTLLFTSSFKLLCYSFCCYCNNDTYHHIVLVIISGTHIHASWLIERSSRQTTTLAWWCCRVYLSSSSSSFYYIFFQYILHYYWMIVSSSRVLLVCIIIHYYYYCSSFIITISMPTLPRIASSRADSSRSKTSLLCIDFSYATPKEERRLAAATQKEWAPPSYQRTSCHHPWGIRGRLGRRHLST